jgi:hypothetical protein
MRARVDARICAQLDLSRSRWVTRQQAAEWSTWVTRTSQEAFRDLSPRLDVLRIHSLPGTLWEVLHDSEGQPWLIADTELALSLAELRLLSVGSADRDSALDRMMLLLADGFRSCGNTRHYAACVGTLLPRSERIVALRRAATATPGNSADAVILLLHELAHQVQNAHPDATRRWREAAVVALYKIAAAVSDSPMREGLVQKAKERGFARAGAKVDSSLSKLHVTPRLHEALTCDVLAALGFLNLRTASHLLADPDRGPQGLSTQDVSDAFCVAHGALQNLHLIAEAREIAESALDSTRRRGVPAVAFLELTVRSSALAHILGDLLSRWCVERKLTDDLAKRIAGGEAQLVSAVAKRSKLRQRTLLEPLEELDKTLLDEKQFEPLEAEARKALMKNGVHVERDLDKLDLLRWGLTTEAAKDQ